ncbi:hypothetical protein SISSUDRAFT_519288 [Sistotremastrum suecicum HHB10207 ss-3]|uniref:Uncharacterized protein n=1 Tax=Sistotremastrum suecicum HHB10207 ss-3 TaxID=1314776 RepID=A0A166F9V9_9AGAM|nr:hypothetical protein SISSUDRAFT_519288 [Sistotremastrum suecicum HHB10207 ss-3]
MVNHRNCAVYINYRHSKAVVFGSQNMHPSRLIDRRSANVTHDQSASSNRQLKQGCTISHRPSSRQPDPTSSHTQRAHLMHPSNNHNHNRTLKPARRPYLTSLFSSIARRCTCYSSSNYPRYLKCARYEFLKISIRRLLSGE